MIVYSEDEKAKDFNFFKKINKEYFEKNGHKFLAIKKESVIDAADEIPELISKWFDSKLGCKITSRPAS